MPFLVNLLIGVALQIIGYMLAPKPPREQPPEAQDMENPTAEAGRPVPVVFGSVIITSPNYLWWGDKRKVERNKDEGTKKK